MILLTFTMRLIINFAYLHQTNMYKRFVILFLGVIYVGMVWGQALQQKLTEISSKGGNIKAFVADPGGGWVILYNDYNFAYKNISPELGRELMKLNQEKKVIESLAISPSGGWALAYDKHRFVSKNIPSQAQLQLETLQSKQLPINHIAFSDGGAWVIVYDQNKFAAKNLPVELMRKLSEISASRKVIRSIAFTPDGGWMVIFGVNEYIEKRIPQALKQAANEVKEKRFEMKLVSFTQDGEYALVYDFNKFHTDIIDVSLDNVAIENSPNAISVQEVLPASANKPRPPAKSVKIWAVLVGVADYTSVKSLKYTDDDAYKLAMFLKSPEGGALPDEQLRVLIDEDATKARILSAMNEVFSQAGYDDVILFYFSGHGTVGAFLPTDYKDEGSKILHAEIKQIFDSSPAKNKVCIADACHSGSIEENLKDVTVESLLDTYYQAWYNSSGGTALLMSSKSEEKSIEYKNVRQGVFSFFLIKGLKGEADGNGDQIVTIKELFDYVQGRVNEYTKLRQTPILTGDFDDFMPLGVVRK